MIAISQIPTALRYPGAYVAIDGSQAGLGGDIPDVLIVGQKFPAGSAPVGQVTQVFSLADAQAKAGAGSMLAKMYAAYRAIDPTFDIYFLPYQDNAAGVAATATIDCLTAATGSGTLAIYIGNYLVNVGITAGAGIDVISASITAAIAAEGSDICVTAADDPLNTGNTILTAKHKGSCGNNIDIRLSLNGEPRPAGTSFSITPFVGGVGDPVPGDIASMIGESRWIRYVALGMNDAVTVKAWDAESKRRYLPPLQSGFRVFTAERGSAATATTYGAQFNAEHIACLSLELNPTTTWEAAAIVCAAAAPRLFNNPVQSLEGTPLPGMVGKTYHTWTNANSLLYSGMSMMQVAKDGSCSIKRLISMYRFRPDGSSDDAFLDINTAETMERIRYEQRIGAIQRFTGTAAAASNEGYRPGLRITTVDDVRAYLLSTYKNKLMQEFGWVQNYDYYKANLIVEQDPTNPSRFNFADQPVLLSPYYILAGIAQFRKIV